MAKILNSTNFNGYVSKLIEIGDQFVINGQVYDKGSLSPISMEFLPIYSSSLNEMYLKQTAYINGRWYGNRTKNGYMEDNNDMDTCYVVTQGVFDDKMSCYFHKITRTPNGLINTKSYNLGNSYYQFIDLISQDERKIYYVLNRDYNAGRSYIGSFNKDTLGRSETNLNTGSIKLLKETDIYIYIITHSYNINEIKIGKYHKINNSITWIFNDKQDSGYYGELEVNDMNEKGVFYGVNDGIGLGLSNHFLVYKKYTLDINKDSVKHDLVNVDMSLLPDGVLRFYTGSDMRVNHSLFDYIDSKTGKKYINHLIYNRGVSSVSSSYLNARDSGLYTYEIIDEDNWKLVSYTLFNPVVYKAFLTVYNNQLLALTYENGTHFYSWDTASASYKKVSYYDRPIRAIGVDSNNNVYIQYDDTSIEMVSNVMPSILFADFDSDTYNYENTDLQANVIVYAKNFLGEYLTANVTLTLYGNVRFTDNGSKVKSVTTSNLDKLIIPVTIYDTGSLRVAIKIN